MARDDRKWKWHSGYRIKSERKIPDSTPTDTLDRALAFNLVTRIFVIKYANIKWLYLLLSDLVALGMLNNW